MKILTKSLRIVAVLVCIIMIASIGMAGSGCKPASSQASATPEETTAATKTEASAETTAKEVSSEKPVELVMWWWDEQEFAGLQGWLDETIVIFQEEHPNVTVAATSQTTENVFSDFPTAAAAGNPPDLQFMWNGVYSMDWAWQDF